MVGKNLFGILLAFAALASIAPLAFAGSIAGHVDDGSAYLSGATVYAVSLENGNMSAPVLTNAGGFFNITGLGTGNYNVTATQAGYYPFVQTFYDPGGAFVNESNPAKVDRYMPFFNFTLQPVVASGNLQGYIINQNGAGIFGASIALYRTGAPAASTSSGAGGVYQINVLEPSTYDVVVTANGYLTATTTAAIIPSQTTRLNVTLFASPTNGSVHGFVRNGSGSPVASATITAFQGTTIMGATSTAADGSYTLALSPGLYSLTAGKANYTSQTVTNVLVSSGASPQVDFIINPVAASATVAYVRLTPVSVNLTAGQSQQFTAIAVYTDGNTQDVTGISTWSFSGSIGGNITSGGLFTARLAGTGTVTARYQNKTNSSAVRISAASLFRLGLSPTSTSVSVGGTRDFTAAGYDIYGNSLGTISDSALSWNVTGGIGTISSGGLFTASTVGSGNVTARYLSNLSVNGTAAVTVTHSGGGGGGGGDGGGGTQENKSYIGQPCNTTADCFYGQCINFVCTIPNDTPTGPAIGGNATNVTPVSQPRIVVQLLAPQIVEKGDPVALTLLTLEGKPVADARIVIIPPVDPSFTILTNKSGMTEYAALREGLYEYAVPDYDLKANVTTRAVVTAPPPVIPPLNNTPITPVVNVSNGTNVPAPPTDFAGAFFAALRNGASSLMNAFGSSFSMWLVIAVVLFAALLLVVVYMVLYGIKKSEQTDKDRTTAALVPEESYGPSASDYSGAGVTEKDLEAISFEPRAEDRLVGKMEKELDSSEPEPKPKASADADDDLEGLTRELEDRLERLRKRRRESG